MSLSVHQALDQTPGRWQQQSVSMAKEMETQKLGSLA
jgi:hypothetical protein